MSDVENIPFQVENQGFLESPPESPFSVGEAGVRLGEGSSRIRAKSALRLRYEAEIGVLKRKLGDLEAIRTQLGLSQRKICQLLLVDPSAWTRWVKSGESAPPHIYRALQWYLALQEKYPALDVNFWLSTAPRAQAPLAIDASWEATSGEIAVLRAKVEALQERCDLLSQAPAKASKHGEPDTRRAFVKGFTAATVIACLIAVALFFVI